MANPQRAKLEIPVGKTIDVPAHGYLRYAVTDGGSEILQVQKGSDNSNRARFAGISNTNSVSLRGLRPGVTTLILFLQGGTQNEYDVSVRSDGHTTRMGSVGSDSAQSAPTAGLQTSGTQQLAAASTTGPVSSTQTNQSNGSVGDERSAAIQRAIGRETITVRMEGDAVVLEGAVESQIEKERAEKIAQQFSTVPVRNRIKVAVSQAAEPKPLDVELTPRTSREGNVVPGEIPTIELEVGLSYPISVHNNLLKVLVSDETIAEPVVVSAREVVLNGKKPGKTSFLVWEARTPNDVIGRETRYLVEVVSPQAPVIPPPQGLTPPTGTGPPAAPADDPQTVQKRIEEALDMPTIKVRVIRSQSGSLAAILTGEVETPEQVAQISQIVSLFVPQVISGGLKAKNAEASLPPLEGDDQKMTALLHRLFPGNQSLQMMKVQGGAGGPAGGGGGGGGAGAGGGGGGKIIVKGTVKSREEASIVTEVARLYAGMPGNVIPFLQVTGENGKTGPGVIHQIVSEVKVVEISKTAEDKLGISWGTSTATAGAGAVGTITPGQVSFLESHPGPGGWTRPVPFAAKLDALVTEGKARVLSDPNITTLEAVQADIIVGGSIPIPSISTAAGGIGTTTSTVTFRPFGVILSVLPEATSNKQIIMQLNVQVSSPDFGNAVNIQGSVIPGFKTRQTDSTVTVNDGDTLVIGGLLSEDVRKNINKIPILSKIPIFGELFKSKDFQRGETELVIFLTPRVKDLPTDLEGFMKGQYYKTLSPLILGGTNGGIGGTSGGGIGGTSGGGGTAGGGTGGGIR